MEVESDRRERNCESLSVEENAWSPVDHAATLPVPSSDKTKCVSPRV
jgi:hypothetical protein